MRQDHAYRGVVQLLGARRPVKRAALDGAVTQDMLCESGGGEVHCLGEARFERDGEAEAAVA